MHNTRLPPSLLITRTVPYIFHTVYYGLFCIWYYLQGLEAALLTHRFFHRWPLVGDNTSYGWNFTIMVTGFRQWQSFLGDKQARQPEMANLSEIGALISSSSLLVIELLPGTRGVRTSLLMVYTGWYLI